MGRRRRPTGRLESSTILQSPPRDTRRRYVVRRGHGQPPRVRDRPADHGSARFQQVRARGRGPPCGHDVAALAPAYAPRGPTETALYDLCAKTSSRSCPTPASITTVDCPGTWNRRCDRCGRHLLVAFSCHGRAVCPSCTGRRMANGAPQIVDRVLPSHSPIRSFVVLRAPPAGGLQS